MRSKQALVVLAVAALLSACSNGGSLSLEPGVKKVTSKGSPFVTVNQGGQASIVEAGKTASTGVHGYVTVQAVTARTLASGSNEPIMILNKAQSQSNH